LKKGRGKENPLPNPLPQRGAPKEFPISLTPTALTISAVPEPSTYALLAGSAMLGFVVLRRRRMVS